MGKKGVIVGKLVNHLLALDALRQQEKVLMTKLGKDGSKSWKERCDMCIDEAEGNGKRRLFVFSDRNHRGGINAGSFLRRHCQMLKIGCRSQKSLLCQHLSLERSNWGQL